jgi:ribosomal-protein-alanine N-acetyltransferase
VSLPVLETGRLVLRPFVPEDIDEVAAMYADPEVVRFIGDGTTATREESAEWLERCLAHWREHGFGHWCVRRRENDAFVGRCGLQVQRFEGLEEIEVGYVLVRSWWGRGFATEAAAATRDHGFQALGLGRLISLIQPANEASKRVATRIGMRYERDVEFGTQWELFGRRVQMYSVERP